MLFFCPAKRADRGTLMLLARNLRHGAIPRAWAAIPVPVSRGRIAADATAAIVAGVDDLTDAAVETAADGAVLTVAEAAVAADITIADITAGMAMRHNVVRN